MATTLTSTLLADNEAAYKALFARQDWAYAFDFEGETYLATADDINDPFATSIKPLPTADFALEWLA